MNGDYLTDKGLKNGRDWGALTTDGGPLEWTVDSQQGLIQGPLDLEFLRGKKLSLILEEGQLALLLGENELKAVFLDGAHYLDIGHGRGQVTPDHSIVFLAADRALNLRWTAKSPLRLSADHPDTLIGNCRLDIIGPTRFYRTFLEGTDSWDEDFILRLLDQMVRGAIGDVLESGPDNRGDFSRAEIQSRLTNLSPEDLDDTLEACGLNCCQLAVYTSTPPVEEGQSDSLVPETARPETY